MKVSELITLLSGYNPNMPVYVDDWDAFEVNTGEDENNIECLVFEQP